jgi:2-polyprenyl-3-methyl-5-hydroxy-6-metoxy-1,4-benzoquinol methylase
MKTRNCKSTILGVTKLKKILASMFGFKHSHTLNNLHLERSLVYKSKDTLRILEYDEGEDVNEWILKGIKLFKEWYQPVDFGDGIVAHITTPPDWKPEPDMFNDKTRGMSKWNYIVKRHIPNVEGMRILDLGCSNGLFSIELARMGAREVIGIDRDETIIKHAHHYSSNVVSQAIFVKKAFEIKENTLFPITYIPYDIGRVSELDLGYFDLILALNVVYHELNGTPELLRQLANMTSHLILQTNLKHSNELKKWASPPLLIELLINNAFTYVEVDIPRNYYYPVIVAKKAS